MPRISIIIPVYNVERFLARCLDSVLEQTEPDLEVICVNDGATDSSPAILEQYRQRDARVRVFEQVNQGQGAARNFGMTVAKGEWIMFVDADDYLPRDAVEGFLRVADESGAPIVASAVYAVDELKEKLPRKFHWTLQKPALAKLVGRRKLHSSPWNKIFRADFVKNHRYIVRVDFEDWPFVTECFGDAESFAKIKEPCYVYCKNEGAFSSVRSPFILRKMLSYRRSINYLHDYFKNHPMKKWALKRIQIAEKMVAKRVRRMADTRSVSLRGGLGNQLFQYAFAKALAKTSGAQIFFDLSWFDRAKKTIVNANGEKANGCKIRDFALTAFPAVRVPEPYPEQRAMYDEKSRCPKFLRKLLKIPRYRYQIEEKDALKPCATDHLYVGYFQSEKYFREVADDLRADLAFPPLKNSRLADTLARIRACENSVCLHIRRGDYVKLGWQLGLNYYREAIARMAEKVKNPTFFIFSDEDPQWIRENLALDYPFEIIGNANDQMDDLQLMAACAHTILANSSFSWWAAWLNQNAAKIVFAPSPWFPKATDDSIICSDWLKIPADFSSDRH